MRARLWAYPWDIIEEGADAVMARVAGSGFDAVSVCVLYHGGMLLLPHNPIRKVYFPEDGVVYFVPDGDRYRTGPLQPVVSELARHADPLAIICQAAASHGLATVAWVVALHNARLGLHHPELTLENVFGDRYPYALCPSQPAVGNFLEGLISDLSSRYPLAAIEVEALYHQAYPHSWSHPKEGISRTVPQGQLLSLCFCSACSAAAVGDGIDVASVRRGVREALEDGFGPEPAARLPDGALGSPEEMEALVPGAAGYLSVRTRTVTALLRRLCMISSVPIQGIIGSGLIGCEWQPGIAVDEWAVQCDAVTVNCYAQDAPGAVEEQIASARRRVGGGALYIGLQATWPQVGQAAELRHRFAEARSVAADGVSIYNYGLMPLWHMDWVKSALQEVANG